MHGKKGMVGLMGVVVTRTRSTIGCFDKKMICTCEVVAFLSTREIPFMWQLDEVIWMH